MDLVFDWYSKAEKFDKKTPTSKEIAEGFAYLLKNYEKMSKKLYSKSDVDIILCTHAMMPEFLLKEILIRKKAGKKIKGFESLKEIGGFLGEVEPIKFNIKRDEKGESDIGLYFRGKNYDIDMKRLNQLANNYKKYQPKK